MQALVAVRFLVFVAAAEHWVLRIPWRRVWLARIAAIAALYIAAQSLLQVVTGRNLQGYRRWGDGEITGPFEHPRAGAPFSRLLFPAVLPAMARLNRWAGLVLLVASVLVVVLIGQRMPLLLTGLGLFVTALLLPPAAHGRAGRLRRHRAAGGRLRRGGAADLLPPGRKILEPDGAFPRKPLRPDRHARGSHDRGASRHRPRLRRLPPPLCGAAIFPWLARRRWRRRQCLRAAPA